MKIKKRKSLNHVEEDNQKENKTNCEKIGVTYYSKIKITKTNENQFSKSQPCFGSTADSK